MRPRLHIIIAAVVLAGLWGLSPIVARAQTDGTQTPEATPTAPATSGTTTLEPGQITSPGANPAQQAPGYANQQPLPSQPFATGNGSVFSTAQPSFGAGLPSTNARQPTYGYGPPANLGPPSFGYGASPPPVNRAQPIVPNIQTPTNAMQRAYQSRPSYTTVVPLGNVSRPSYVTAQSLNNISPAGQFFGRPSYVTAQPHGNVAHPSYMTAQSLSSISPAGQYFGRPAWAVSQPAYRVGQPSYATIQMRGNLGQLPQNNNIQSGSMIFMPGTFPQGYTGQYVPGVLHR